MQLAADPQAARHPRVRDQRLHGRRGPARRRGAQRGAARARGGLRRGDGPRAFILGDDEVEVPAGSFVFLRDPQTKRGAARRGPGTTVLAVGGKPGEARAVGVGVVVRGATRIASGRLRAGARDHRRGLEQNPSTRRSSTSARAPTRRAGPPRRGARRLERGTRARAELQQLGRRGRGPRRRYASAGQA